MLDQDDPLQIFVNNNDTPDDEDCNMCYREDNDRFNNEKEGDDGDVIMISNKCIQKVDDFMTEVLDSNADISVVTNDTSVVTPPIVEEQQQQKTASPAPCLTGRPPNMIYLSCDPDNLSPYQVLVRKQIEVFEAVVTDVISNAQGRNNPIVLGQVGIRCRHCAYLPPKQRSKGAVYFPTKLLGVYQAAQNIASIHLCASCPYVPMQIRNELLRLRDPNAAGNSGSHRRGGGKQHWAEAIGRGFGVYEDSYGLRYESRLNMM